MFYIISDKQKKMVAEFIESQPKQGVEVFNYLKKQVAYSSLIAGKKISEIKGDEEIARALKMKLYGKTIIE